MSLAGSEASFEPLLESYRPLAHAFRRPLLRELTYTSKTLSPQEELLSDRSGEVRLPSSSSVFSPKIQAAVALQQTAHTLTQRLAFAAAQHIRSIELLQ